MRDLANAIYNYVDVGHWANQTASEQVRRILCQTLIPFFTRHLFLPWTKLRAVPTNTYREGELKTKLLEDTKRTAHQALVTRVLEGDGRSARAERRAAFENAGLAEPLATLIDKVARQPTRITDEDIAAVLASGVSEDQIFELVVCAAIGQATRQYETALAALAEAVTGEKGKE